jgi:hypothetical protein
MKNLLIEKKFTEDKFIELILSELYNSEIINDEEFELAIINTNFELIQKHCIYKIKQVLENLSNIDNMELDDIIFFFGFDVSRFIEELKKIIMRPQNELLEKLNNYVINNLGILCVVENVTINDRNNSEKKFLEQYISAMMYSSFIEKYI